MDCRSRWDSECRVHFDIFFFLCGTHIHHRVIRIILLELMIFFHCPRVIIIIIGWMESFGWWFPNTFFRGTIIIINPSFFIVVGRPIRIQCGWWSRIFHYSSSSGGGSRRGIPRMICGRILKNHMVLGEYCILPIRTRMICIGIIIVVVVVVMVVVVLSRHH